jgi:DNA-cytosine methyltransferase
MQRIRVGSFFSGLGAFEKALERLGIPHEIAFYCEIDKYASRSFSLIHNVPESLNLWDITKVDEAKLPDFDLMTWGFPCFPGGTLVMTSKGHKEIQDINVGDKVLTHKNRFKKVVKTMQKPCSALYNVKVFGVEEFNVTAEHPFYVRKFKRVWDCANKTNKRLFGEPEWVEVKDLDKNCYIGIAINQKSKLPLWQGYEYKHQNRITKCKNELNFENENLWWLIGRYMGDGWTSVTDRKSKPNSPNYRTIICCAKSEINDITQKLDGLFSYSVAEERTVYKIHIVNKELTLFLQQFGQGASNKRITSDILNLPVCLLESFLKGYFSADGCYSQGLYKATSVSRQLTYGIQACIYKVYRRPCALYKNKRPKTSVIEGRTINQKDIYNIAFKKENGKQDKAFYEDGYIWIPFRRKDVIEFNDDVYNFEVEEDNSYTAFNLIVHNCQDISVAGKQAGVIEGETRSGLYYDGIRILRHKKPKYSIIENVKNLTSEAFRPVFYQILCDLEDAGYKSYWQVLNAKDYGVPQNRERVFIVSIRNDIEQDFDFPVGFDNGIRLKDLLEDEVDEKYYISQEKTEQLLKSIGLPDDMFVRHTSDGFHLARKDTKRSSIQGTHVTYPDGNSHCMGSSHVPMTVMPVLTPDREEKRQNGRRFKDDGEPMFTLTGQDRHGILMQVGTLKGCGMPYDKMHESSCRVYSPEGLAPTVNTCGGGNLEPKVLIKAPGPELVGGIGDINFGKQYRQGNRIYSAEKTAVALMSGPVGNTGGNSYLYLHNYRIRKLTPLECFRLMNFDDADWQVLVDNGISDSQLYKMAGNSIVVRVLEKIMENMFLENTVSCTKQLELFG